MYFFDERLTARDYINNNFENEFPRPISTFAQHKDEYIYISKLIINQFNFIHDAYIPSFMLTIQAHNKAYFCNAATFVIRTTDQIMAADVNVIILIPFFYVYSRL